MRGLRALGAQELAARGHGAEQVADLDGGAPRVAGIARVQETPVAHFDLGAARRTRLARAQDEAGDAGDRRQGLAAESMGGHALEVAQLA